MSENTKDTITLRISEESVSNIIYEDSSKFQESISREAYRKAHEITQVIIDVNKQYQGKGKYREEEREGSRGTANRNRGQFFNIIAFTGDRGTGKTSAMLSYMEFLKDYYRKFHWESDEDCKELRFKETRDGADLMFTGLEYIDASLLGAKSDDILRNVLPKMVKKLHDEEKRSYKDSGIVRDEDYAYKKRKIHMQFNNVYKSLKNLNSSKDILESDNDMFMETLENLSLTWNLRQSFQQLVEDYLDIMEYSGTERRIGRDNHFLVISLDDLDMNIEHGFELLEEIRKYLMVPNVIVLLSANYEQLEKLCIDHYTKNFKEIKGETGTKEYIAKLSREYLQKILPSHCQVVLDSMNQWKAYDQNKLKIEYSGNNEKKLEIQPNILKKTLEDKWTEYLDMKFLKEGVCFYYSIPSTLRELAVWVRQIYSLKSLNISLDTLRTKGQSKTAKEDNAKENNPKEDNPKENELEIFQKNLEWFWKVRFSWMCDKHLTQADRLVFQTIGILEPTGQIATLKEALIKDEKKGNSLLEILGEKITGTKGEQTFAALSIIYLTAKLTGLFYQWYIEEEQERGKKALKDIRQYFKGGIWGKWEERMAGQMITRAGVYVISRIDFDMMNNCLNQAFEGPFPLTKEEKEEFVNRNKQAVINYQIRLLFFDFPSDFSFSKAELKPEGEQVVLYLNIDKCKGSFALSNIMRVWEDKESVLKDFRKNFLRMLNEKPKTVEEPKTEEPETVEELKTEEEAKTVEKQKSEEQKQEGELKPEESQPEEEQLLNKDALNEIRIDSKDCYIKMPLENVEWLINVGKKLQEQLENHVTGAWEEEGIYVEIRDYFKIIQECLEDYGNGYEKQFDDNQIWKEVQGGPVNKETDLLYMLSESIQRAAVPRQVYWPE